MSIERDPHTVATVSVIIPLYNKKHTIRRAIESVLRQTHTDFEVLVIDDGSTDGGADIVRKGYSDSRITLTSQKNAGPGAARNRGIRDARGQYVAFLDADDEWESRYLEASVAILSNHPDCDLCVASWHQDYSRSVDGRRNVDVRENQLSTIGRELSGPIRLLKHRDARLLSGILLYLTTNVVCVRRSALLRYSGFHEACKYGEDYYLWFQLLLNHKAYFNPEPLAWYHDSESELNVGQYSVKPLAPYFADFDTIYRSTPARNKEQCVRWISILALANAHKRLMHGDFKNARWLMESFPAMKSVCRLSYAKLILKYYARRYLRGGLQCV